MNKLKFNIPKLYLIKALQYFMLSMPIIVLFFNDHHGLSFMDIMILKSIYSFSIAILEIPSGILSDYIGKKTSIAFGCVFMFFGFLLFSYFSNYEIFIIAEILLAIGSSMISGSDSALLYDSLINLKSEKKYTKIEGRNYSIGNFSEAIAGILGGFLASFSLLLPIYIQTGVLFSCILVSFTLIEPINNNRKVNSSINDIFRDVIYILTSNRKLLWIILFSSIMGLASLSTAWLVQPYLIEINLTIAFFGMIWAFLNITAGIGSFYSFKIEKHNTLNNIIIYASILISIPLLILFFQLNTFGIAFLFLIYLIRGAIHPILKNNINMITQTNIRSTILSIRNFGIRVAFAIISPILGYLADLDKGINFSFLVLFLIVSLSTIILIILKLFWVDEKK